MKEILLLAETDLATAIGKIINLLQMVSMAILVASLIVAGVSVTSGRLEFVKFGIIGAAMAALSWVLVQALFSSVAGTVIDVSPQAF